MVRNPLLHSLLVYLRLSWSAQHICGPGWPVYDCLKPMAAEIRR
jgi:hypothetical protein